MFWYVALVLISCLDWFITDLGLGLGCVERIPDTGFWLGVVPLWVLGLVRFLVILLFLWCVSRARYCEPLLKVLTCYYGLVVLCNFFIVYQVML